MYYKCVDVQYKIMCHTGAFNIHTADTCSVNQAVSYSPCKILAHRWPCHNHCWLCRMCHQQPLHEWSRSYHLRDTPDHMEEHQLRVVGGEEGGGRGGS